jgi:hypothetical protein
MVRSHDFGIPMIDVQSMHEKMAAIQEFGYFLIACTPRGFFAQSQVSTMASGPLNRDEFPIHVYRE